MHWGHGGRAGDGEPRGGRFATRGMHESRAGSRQKSREAREAEASNAGEIGERAADAGPGLGNGIWDYTSEKRDRRRLALFSSGAQHKGADGFAGVLAFIEDQLHLPGDGHFNAVLAGKAESGVRGVHALSNFAAERAKNLG